MLYGPLRFFRHQRFDLTNCRFGQAGCQSRTLRLSGRGGDGERDRCHRKCGDRDPAVCFVHQDSLKVRAPDCLIFETTQHFRDDNTSDSLQARGFQNVPATSAATTVRKLKPPTTALGLLDGNAKRSEFSEEIALTIVLAPNVASV